MAPPGGTFQYLLSNRWNLRRLSALAWLTLVLRHTSANFQTSPRDYLILELYIIWHELSISSFLAQPESQYLSRQEAFPIRSTP